MHAQHTLKDAQPGRGDALSHAKHGVRRGLFARPDKQTFVADVRYS